jgi:PAS domain S-box-containing protein
MRYSARQSRVGTKESGAAVMAQTCNLTGNFAPATGAAGQVDMTGQVVANILLVDDHPPNLLALEAILRPLGQRLIKVESGRDALKCLTSQQVALALLDVRMPGLDGFRTADLIRKERPDEPLPIIFLTAADTDLAEILRGYERGAVDFLMKPFEPEILRSKVAVFVELYKKEQTVRRQAAQLRLKEREALEDRNAARFHQLLDAVPICVVVTDHERRPYYWNQSALSYLGVPVEELNAAGLLGSIHPDDFEHLAAEWTTAEHDKRPFELKSRIRRHDGSYRWHLGRGVPQFDETITLTGWIVTATDIEDQSQALAQAETANRVKDEFLAVVSHELRNPLNAISGWVHLLRSGLDETRIRRAVEIIERNVNLQVALIDEILDLSRIARNKVRLACRPLDLSSTLRSSLTALRPLADQKGVQLDLKAAEEGIFVNGDPERLQQIIGNLVSNAIKFTPRDGRVTIDLRRDEEQASLKITDTGTGISPEFLPHVFDPFRQAESTTTRQHGGLGLGLAISKRLVELHRGQLRAESGGLNQGASFIVTLPLLPPDFETRPERTGRGHFEAASLTGLKILIVDDDPDTREILTEILGERGAVVAVASSASDAMAEIAEAVPDVVVSDIAMPGEDGLSLVRRLNQHAAIRDHRIVTIALTGLSAPEHQRLALEAGFEACLKKPLEPARLIEYIVDSINRSAPA